MLCTFLDIKSKFIWLSYIHKPVNKPGRPKVREDLLMNFLKSTKKFCYFILLFSFLIPSARDCFSQWSQIATINTTELRAVKFFNEHTGIAAGVGGVWRSTSSGVNWVQMISGVNINGISFYDNNNGYAVGDSGKIFRTTNNGTSWVQQGVGVTSNNLYGCIFSTSIRFHAVGAGGIILVTVNGGSTWAFQSNSGVDLYSVIMNAVGEGYTVGSSASEVVRLTNNAGTNWVNVLNAGGNNCYDISFINNSSNVLVIGNNGRIRKTTNGGIFWTFPQSNSNVNLNAVTFINSSVAFIAGNSGLIFKTTNEGFNWSYQSVGYPNNLKDISFINEQTGWTVGENGIVLRTGIPVGIEKVGNNIPSQFELYQNYPNPFNPLTNIKFDLMISSYVKLIVYDILGKEIEILLNQKINAGSYEYRWNGINLPSGTYFYRFITEDYSETKKMILIK